MRLKQLKLAGFKSFVDAVTIPLPSQLVAVVGPNGCGKSNIIDAVRWVMGESQAKQLRGEAITDVIFKGSSHRKSIGQASVELVFDNSLGKLSGPFASYQEIAIKRVVNREGESTYFLNGTRCRRRDITDIFLGTGVGARGYSVIGQDTISRLIEARPEELRAYIEEAAGVSKYKERRRETMQRIGQTRENLARIADIQAELAKQLARLERQAKTAQRYLQYKQDEQQHRFAIHAIQWRELDAEHQRCKATQIKLQQEDDRHQTQLGMHLKTLATQQEMAHELSAAHEATQALCYQNKTELVRLEQTIQHQTLRQQQCHSDEQQLTQELAQTQRSLQGDEAAYHASQQRAQSLHSEWQALEGDLEKAREALKQLENTELEWQAAWQINSKRLNEIERDQQLETLKQTHHEERAIQRQVQYERQQIILASKNEIQLSRDVIQAKNEQEKAEKYYQTMVDAAQQCSDKSSRLRQQKLEIDQKLDQQNDKLQRLTAEHAGLQAAQVAALKMKPVSSSTHAYPRLVEHLHVEDAWRCMVEKVLGDNLQAMVVEQIEDILSDIEKIQNQSLLFVQRTPVSKTLSYPRLVDKLEGSLPCGFGNFNEILAAENLQQALDWLQRITDEQSIVTPDGYWLGLGWIRSFDMGPADESGLLTRQHLLSQLKTQLDSVRSTHQSWLDQRKACHEQLVDLDHQQASLQKQIKEASDLLRLTQAAYHQATQFEKQALLEKSQAIEACEAIGIELESLAELRQKMQLAIEMLSAQREHEMAIQAKLMSEKNHGDLLRQKAQTGFEKLHAVSQDLKLTWAQEDAKHTHLAQQIQRSQAQCLAIEERLSQIQAQAMAFHPSLMAMQASLEEKLLEHQQLEKNLSTARTQLESLQQVLHQTEQLCKYEEKQAKGIQHQLQQLHIQVQTTAARASDHAEVLHGMDQHWQTRLVSLHEAVTREESESALAAVEANITRLGPINLLAVDEYAADLARKSILDAQSHDLTEALVTLERAIMKMDQETQQRFKETFNQVNSAFQILFPRLFGGGHATLEMTCDNLLEAGVLVMAQPPGKRNNTIYMLSGGEKAMTAVALVIAIFQLNPSPFCMLDEVDAPLDEANVRRFCELVHEMSQIVQFLLITHNKVTMEIAENLIGVTMREPGVSGIVSVDVTTMI